MVVNVSMDRLAQMWVSMVEWRYLSSELNSAKKNQRAPEALRAFT